MKKTTLIFNNTTDHYFIWSCTSKQEKMENRMKAFISAYEAKAIPLYKESALWHRGMQISQEQMKIMQKARKLHLNMPKYLLTDGICRT